MVMSSAAAASELSFVNKWFLNKMVGVMDQAVCPTTEMSMCAKVEELQGSIEVNRKPMYHGSSYKLSASRSWR